MQTRPPKLTPRREADLRRQGAKIVTPKGPTVGFGTRHPRKKGDRV